MRQMDLGENSALTSENAKQQMESDVATADNNDNVNYANDDTILLEKEITDVIGDGPILRDGLPVETTSRDETQEITDQLADLTVKKKAEIITKCKKRHFTSRSNRYASVTKQRKSCHLQL